MKKILILISIILLIVSVSCIYADENNNTDTNQETNNQKYYVEDTYGNQYYFYENGTTGAIDPWGREKDHETPILNKNQIDYYIEHGDFSYALAYLKCNHEHGGNLTYDEVYNSAVQGDAGKTKNWIFYNNGTVTRNITMHYNNGTSKIIPYSTTYTTSIKGFAKWFDIIDMYEGGDPGFPYSRVLLRYEDGAFDDIIEPKIDYYEIEPLADDKNTTTNQIENTKNNTTNQTITNIDNITPNSTNTNINTTQNNYNNTSTTNITQSNNKENTNIEVINTANPLIILLIACILIPMGLYRKRK